jgi:hypothetical protein
MQLLNARNTPQTMILWQQLLALNCTANGAGFQRVVVQLCCGDLANTTAVGCASSAHPCACLRALERLADHRSLRVPLQWFGLVSADQLVWGGL